MSWMTRRTALVAASLFLVIAVALVSSLGPRASLSDVAFVIRNAELASRVIASDLCYGVFLQGRSEADVRAAELGPYLDPRASWFSVRVDSERRIVKASLFGFFRSRAFQHDDWSCRVGEAPTAALTAAQRVPPSDPDPRPWPAGDARAPDWASVVPDLQALRDAVEPEFEPSASGLDRGTRSVLVVHRGRLVYERHADGWDRFTPQNGRSMTKVLAAILAGVATGQDQLTLDQGALRPEWTDDRADIRLAHLLTMRSGLSWNESNGPGDNAEALFMVDNAADYAAGKPLAGAPGAEFGYSGADADLTLSVALNRLRAGVATPERPEQALFDALGMWSVVLDRDRSGAAIASTNMYAAATDWARLGLFLARDGVWDGERLLPYGWIDFMRTPTTESRCNYGAMVWIRGGCTDGQPAEVFELSGFMGQGVTIVPKTETIIVRTGFGPWIMSELLERVFEALEIEAPTKMAMEMTDQDGEGANRP